MTAPADRLRRQSAVIAKPLLIGTLNRAWNQTGTARGRDGQLGIAQVVTGTIVRTRARCGWPLSLRGPDKLDSTFSLSAPLFETQIGTGCIFSENYDSIYEYLHQHDAAASSVATLEETPLLLDVASALRAARMQAGLPVQDLAAMFGIKRRQFYNLVSGEDTPEPAREGRIARVTGAISELSEAIGGNSRKVRAVLLARLDGDSMYDAAVADDLERLDAALERASAAAADGAAMPRRASPSSRATAEEAAAARDFLRATRDDMGNAHDA